MDTPSQHASEAHRVYVYSHFPEEKEVLFPPNSRFIISSTLRCTSDIGAPWGPTALHDRGHYVPKFIAMEWALTRYICKTQLSLIVCNAPKLSGVHSISLGFHTGHSFVPPPPYCVAPARVLWAD